MPGSAVKIAVKCVASIGFRLLRVPPVAEVSAKLKSVGAKLNVKGIVPVLWTILTVALSVVTVGGVGSASPLGGGIKILPPPAEPPPPGAPPGDPPGGGGTKMLIGVTNGGASGGGRPPDPLGPPTVGPWPMAAM